MSWKSRWFTSQEIAHLVRYYFPTWNVKALLDTADETKLDGAYGCNVFSRLVHCHHTKYVVDVLSAAAKLAESDYREWQDALGAGEGAANIRDKDWYDTTCHLQA